MTSKHLPPEDRHYINMLASLTSESELGWHSVITTTLKEYGISDHGASARSTSFRGGMLVLVDGAGEEKQDAALYYWKAKKLGIIHSGDRNALSKLLKAVGLNEPALQELDNWLVKSLPI